MTKFEERFKENIEIEPEEEPIEIEPIEEEPIEIEPKEEPIEEEPNEIEPEEEPIEEEPIEIEPEEEPIKIEPEEEPIEEEPTEIEPNKVLVPDKQEYQRTLTKPVNHENLKAGKTHQSQDLSKNRGRIWYKQDRPDLSQTRGSRGEIDVTNLYVCNFPVIKLRRFEGTLLKIRDAILYYCCATSGNSLGYGFSKVSKSTCPGF